MKKLIAVLVAFFVVSTASAHEVRRARYNNSGQIIGWEIGQVIRSLMGGCGCGGDRCGGHERFVVSRYEPCSSGYSGPGLRFANCEPKVAPLVLPRTPPVTDAEGYMWVHDSDTGPWYKKKVAPAYYSRSDVGTDCRPAGTSVTYRTSGGCVTATTTTTTITRTVTRTITRE